MLRFVKKLIPQQIFSLYHWLWALYGAIRYNFPSKQIKVVAVTGTKGKSTTTELVSALLEAGGHKTAAISTIRFKIGNESRKNLLKMTTPGRGMLHRLLREAVSAGCDYAVVEISSEAVKLHRHAFIELDALIFTNLSPEHIESHGSYEKYVEAKLAIAHALERSPKKDKVIVVNIDDREADKFLAFAVGKKVRYSLKGAYPYETDDTGSRFVFEGMPIKAPLPGIFNIYNMMAAASYADTQRVSLEDIKRGLESFGGAAGRMQKIYAEYQDKQAFDVVVDYAHTTESLKAAYSVYAGKRRMICVFGSTGGGRDKWKRPEMGKIADQYCDEIILTNDDPYDEDPLQIIEEVAKGIAKPCDKIVDRRLAIREAIKRARPGDVVMLTGKGTDPYLMEAGGKKTPWSDADFAKEELDKILTAG